MATIDWIILVVYIFGIMAFGFILGKRNKTESDFFHGGRNLPWYAVGVSVGMTMLSAGSFLGNVGWAYSDGILVGMIGISIPLCMLFCTNTILPMLYNSECTTMGQFMNLRFGGNKTRLISLVIWLCLSLVFIGGWVYVPSIVLQAVTGINLRIWVPVICILAIVLTVVGGMKAVVWTDFVQGVILLIGIIIALITVTSIMERPIGDILTEAAGEGKTISYISGFRWDNMNTFTTFFTAFICWVSYYGINQEQVQRYITAKSIRDVKKTGIISSAMMVGIYWMCYFVGILLSVFYKYNTSTLNMADDNNVFLDFILGYIPSGVVGLILAAVFAAAISSLDSMMNSLTATFTKDIYEPYISKGKPATLKQTMTFTVGVGVISIVFTYIYFVGSESSIMQMIASLSAPFQGVLTGVMFTILFLPKVNDKGMWIGATAALFISFFIKSQEVAWGIHWLWGYVYSCAIAMIIASIINFFVKDMDEEKRAYPYTLYGSMKLETGKKDSTGYEMKPLKFDRYAVGMILVQVILCVVLMWIQSY